MNSRATAAELIDRYQLEAHPEGGWYREIHRSDQRVDSPVHGEVRNAFTHIYFLLERDQVSRFHRVLHGEIWNFYQGDPLRLICFGGKIQETLLGDSDGVFAAVVEPCHFQAAETTGEYSLAGCSVAPGFEFADFAFLDTNPAVEADPIAQALRSTHGFDKFL